MDKMDIFNSISIESEKCGNEKRSFTYRWCRKISKKIYRNELDHERFKWQTASEGSEEETDNDNC